MTMLAYHEFSRTPERDVYSLPSETFRRHARLVDGLLGARSCITFDDGHRSQFDFAAPILDEMRLAGIFFITTAWVGLLPSVMCWRDLRELQQAGQIVGSHSHTHPMLTACGPVALRNEMTVSKEVIEQWLGVEVDSISMPGGRINERVLMACGEAGYKRVYTSRVAERKRSTGNLPEVIGRYIVRGGTSDRTLAAYLDGDPFVCRRLEMESRVKTVAKALIGDSLYHRLWRKAARSGAYGS
jgi:peptidoglycan/xylan/chitin deacetylase (PgdA/CDA1 family)